MKAHIARNQNAGIPLALGWNLSAADRGILEGMAPAFGMKLQLVSPADAGRTVAQLLGEVEVKTTRTLVLEPGAYPPALVLANFKDKDVDTLLDLMKQAQRMQRQMEEGQKELEVKEFSAKSGGGAVEAVVNGKKELVKLTISEEAVDPEDVEMLQDMIVAAVNEAMKQADEASQELMGKMTGGLGGGFPF
jgi:DNA-binding YbaB/EbfC family protein